MFDIIYQKEADTVKLSGDFDASYKDWARDTLSNLNKSVIIDMSDLNFICSAGVGILIMTYQNLKKQNQTFTLINLKPHIKKVFEISLLDSVFDIK